LTFLPIVQRELRIAARRKSTFFVRMATSLVALFVGGIAVFFAELTTGPSGPRAAPGKFVFEALSGCLFLLAMLAGVFLAADGLSEERREGTLGFLFLTDLKGYDVVLGKFMAVGLNAFYSLLAIFPILSMCLMAGGTTAGEFLRMALALANTLVFSIAVGLWVSSRSESANHAMSGTLLLLAAVAVLLPMVRAIFAESRFGTAAMIVSMLGPSTAFSLAKAASYYHYGAYFWLALAMTHLVAWGLLGVASRRLPRHLEPGSTAKQKGFWRRLFSADLMAGKRRRNPKWLEINPILWLSRDSNRLKSLMWTLAIVGSGLLLSCLFLRQNGVMVIASAAFPFYFLFKILYVIQACRFFSESRRTGGLELLCTTPISNQTVIRGQWMALRRVFLWPVLLFMATEAVVLILSPWPKLVPLAVMMNYYFPAMVVKQGINSLGDFWSLGWLGMWLAVSCKKPGSAAGLTILFGLVLPAVAVCVPTLAIDAVFVAVFRTKFLQDFRLLATPRS
jgi:ABC-type transport system involved in multi-copper enzyme maturation permease subunit